MKRLLARLGVVFLLTISGAGNPDAALAARGHEFGFALGWGVKDGKAELETCSGSCQPGIAGSGKGQFDAPVGVAVDEGSGDIYVLDESNGRVERFGAKGEYLGTFDGSGAFEVEGKEETGAKPPTGKLLEPRTIAVDNSCTQLKLGEQQCKERDPSYGDVYVADGLSEFHKVIDKFTATGEYIGQILVPLAPEGRSLELLGLAVDSHGNLWVAEDQGLEHRGFDEFDDEATNAHLKFVEDQGMPFEREHPALAVGVNGDLYANTELESFVIRRFTESGKLLGAVEKAPASGVGVDLLSGDAFVDNVQSVGRFTASIPAAEIERFGEGDLVAGRGIGVDSTVSRGGPVYVADDGAADVAVFPLEGPKRPTIAGVSASGIAAGSATLRAVIDPRGARSEYRFEYGACRSSTECGTSGFEANIPATGYGLVGGPLDFEEHEVQVHPQDLRPGATYHFRVLARNEEDLPNEFTEGTERVFRTQPAVPAGRLLDGRGWEMVSPAQKHGTLVRQILNQDVIQAAAGGNAFTYVANTPTEDQPHGFSNFAQVLSRRTSAGWVSEDLGLSHLRATGQSIGQGEEYRFFSEDLSVALVQPFGQFEPATSPEATEQTPYVRTDFSGGSSELPCQADCYQPVVTAGNVREGVRFGEEGSCPPRVICGPVVVGASPDGRHVMIEAPVGLTGAEGDKGGLYEWSNGALSLVSLLPSGEPAPVASSPTLGGGGITRDAVSSDGSRVVWTGKAGTSLYLRDLTAGETVEISRGLEGTPEFQAASTDGSRVFFTDGGELYVYESEKGEAVRLAVPLKGGEPTEVLGKIAGVSEDGSYVYFVADGLLSAEAKPAEAHCAASTAPIARCYMYMLHQSAGAWEAPELVAELSGADIPDFSGALPELTARVSPDGRWLAFMSQLSLTGYDNRDAVSGAGDEEVFLFDGVAGRLTCVSCNPTGARPTGVEYSRLEGGLAAGDRVWPRATWLAANVPGWTPYENGSAFYQSRYLLDDGRVFFNSSDPLAPQDVDGTEDVYEYEPSGVGSCSPASVMFVESAGGCIGLVSAGSSGEESAFLDASASGSDVFVLTDSRLAPTDFDTALDVYDARECTLASPCLPTPPAKPVTCATEASCKAAPAPQPESFGAPSSSTFVGLGNVSPLPTPTTPPPKQPASHRQLLSRALLACRRQHSRSKTRRAACERRAKARYAVRRKPR